jgi:hypothetical protein
MYANAFLGDDARIATTPGYKYWCVVGCTKNMKSLPLGAGAAL